MGFRLVPTSVTLNDLKRRNGRVVCILSPNLLFGTYYVKVVKIHRYILRVNVAKESSF